MTSPHQAGPTQVVIRDSVTDAGAGDRGRVLITGSHGGLFSARRAAVHAVAAVAFNDASRGLDDAGVRGLELLDRVRIPAWAVSADSARIGEGAETWEHGIVSCRNDLAAAAGVGVGDDCRTAAERFAAASGVARTGASAPSQVSQDAEWADGEHLISLATGLVVVCLDSASQVRDSHAGRVVCLGSHGAAPGGEANRALKADVAFAAFNDAGIGKDEAGLARVRLLDARGVPAVAVDAATARIGDGCSTLCDGTVSFVNQQCHRLGGRTGMALTDLMTSIGPALAPAGRS